MGRLSFTGRRPFYFYYRFVKFACDISYSSSAKVVIPLPFQIDNAPHYKGDKAESPTISGMIL